MKNILTPIFALVTLILLTACKGPAIVETDLSTYFLVRHAEKQKGDNPALTEAGEARAIILRDKLKSRNVTHIHSSNYKRTLATAKPLADALGLDIEIYDARDLHALAEVLKGTPGTHLVVGHSNTTPELAALVSGQLMEPMPETEYDRFIEIRIGSDGTLRAVDISKFGAGD